MSLEGVLIAVAGPDGLIVTQSVEDGQAIERVYPRQYQMCKPVVPIQVPVPITNFLKAAKKYGSRGAAQDMRHVAAMGAR